jgi:hypothetical protein
MTMSSSNIGSSGVMSAYGHSTLYIVVCRDGGGWERRRCVEMGI